MLRFQSFSFFQIILQLIIVLFRHIIFYPFSQSYVSLNCTFKSVIANEFIRSLKDRGLKINTDVAPYDQQCVIPKMSSQQKISDTVVIIPDKVQVSLHGSDWTWKPGADHIIVRRTVVHLDSLSLLHPYEFYSILLNEVNDTLGEKFRMVSITGTLRPWKRWIEE